MRALIVKTSSLGDVVQTFPVVEYLKRRQAVDHIGWVVESEAVPLVQAHPLVDTVLEINSSRIKEAMPHIAALRECWRQRAIVREQSWDVLFDVQGNCKSGLVTLNARASTKVGYGRTTVVEWPNWCTTNHHINPPRGLSVRDQYLFVVKKYFNDELPFIHSGVELRLTSSQERSLASKLARWPSSTPVWMIAVGSAWTNKMCKTSTLAEVLQRVQLSFGSYFVFIAGNGEELREVGILASYFPQSSHVVYRPDLPLLQRMMGRAQAVLSVDSLILHLAGTAGVPTFGLFGPSKAEKYAPPGAGFFQGRCPRDVLFERRCPNLRTCLTGNCLKTAEAEAMFEAIRRWQEGLS